MTTENELDVIKTVDTGEPKAEVNSEIPGNDEETPVPETVALKIDDEQTAAEKPKRGGRKKRDGPDVKVENVNDDNAIDTQPLFEQPVIVEGKRSRKPTARLELSDLETPKKELSIPQGHGKPLGDIEYIDYQITNASTDALSRMRNICFGRRASQTNIRQNLRDFNGFEFERDSDEYQRHLSTLTKLKKDQLRSLSDILGLPAASRNEESAESILTFLLAPVDDGKQIPERKMSMRASKKPSTNSKESIPTDEEENEVGEKAENGDDEDELFDVEDEEEEEEGDGTDDDYIGSDEESTLNTKDDDPDDFVYRPGKKTPKKRPSVKRSRSRTTPKRKRGASAASKRGRKKPKAPVIKKVENEDLTTASAEAMQTNNEETDKTENAEETKTDDLNNVDTKLSEQNDATATTTTNITDMVPATS